MPKLSKTRIINLSYNDGRRTLYNELFDYGNGKHTLFSMDNGIGKTVLIQFFLQPFLKNKRELQDRRFENYFVDNSPTYILHEVLLDGGEKLLVGMVIRRDNAEEERNRLRILAFTNRYHKPDDFDIVNAPFVEGKRILKFSEAEERIKSYSRGRSTFQYYNFSDSRKKADYFDALKTHRIDYKEWEDIIRSINNDESGLSNLYAKHRTDEALVRNVMLPLIESKLNGEKNAIETLRGNLGNYIETFKRSKESFAQIEILKTFSADMMPVIAQLTEGGNIEQQEQRARRKLAGVAILCEQEFAHTMTQKVQCEELDGELEVELRQIQLEEQSLKYHSLKQEEAQFVDKLNELQMKLDHVKQQYSGYLREKQLLECADLNEEIVQKQVELAEVRQRLENHEKEDAEIEEQINSFRFTLKQLLGKKLEELIQDVKEQQQQQKLLKEKEQTATVRQGEIHVKQVALSNDQTGIQFRMKQFDNLEQQFRADWTDFKLERNPMFGHHIDSELGNYAQTIVNEVSELHNLQHQVEATLEKTESDQTVLIAAKATATDNLQALALSRVKLEEELKRFEQETAKVSELLTIKCLPGDVAMMKERLRALIIDENNRLSEAQLHEETKLRKAQEQLERYESGDVRLPEEVLSCFEQKGIAFTYAYEFLQRYTGSLAEKEELVRANPFLPYGILLGSKDIAILKEESIETYTSIPIPVFDRSAVNQQLSYQQSCDVITVENQEFLLAFNMLLLDEEQRGRMVAETRTRIVAFEEEIGHIKEARSRNQWYLHVLEHYAFRGDEHLELNAQLQRIAQETEALQKIMAEAEAKLEMLKNQKEQLYREKETVKETLQRLLQKQSQFEKFIEMHAEYKQLQLEDTRLSEQLRQLIQELEVLAVELEQLRQKLQQEGIHAAQLQQELVKLKEEYAQVEEVQSGKLYEGDINTIQARLATSISKLGGNVQQDRKEETRLGTEIRRKQDTLDRKAKNSGLGQEYVQRKYSLQKLEEAERLADEAGMEAERLQKDCNGLDKKVAVQETLLKGVLENIRKLGNEAPLAEGEIKSTQFRERMERVRGDILSNREMLKEYLNMLSRLKDMEGALVPFRSASVAFAPEELLSGLEFNFKSLEQAERQLQGMLGDHEGLRKAIQGMEARISQAIQDIYEQFRDRDPFLRDRLYEIRREQRILRRSSEVESLVEVVSRKYRTLEVELSAIRAEEEIVTNEILRYANHVLQELRTIDKKSGIRHLGRTQKLMEIHIPEEKEEEALRDYIRDRVMYFSSLNEDYKLQLETDISTAELLSKLIGNTNRIRVDIMKIEKTGLVRKRWKELLSANSGGERFVSMFVLLSSLMSYMRKRETDIDTREEQKILVMDNPFAKTTSTHLLEPMFQIADKYNIQLLCFSGIGGSSVYNRFNRIYVAKVIEDKFRNHENLTFRSGSEETLELTDFHIVKEQLTLF